MTIRFYLFVEQFCSNPLILLQKCLYRIFLSQTAMQIDVVVEQFWIRVHDRERIELLLKCIDRFFNPLLLFIISESKAWIIFSCEFLDCFLLLFVKISLFNEDLLNKLGNLEIIMIVWIILTIILHHEEINHVLVPESIIKEVFVWNDEFIILYRLICLLFLLFWS